MVAGEAVEVVGMEVAVARISPRPEKVARTRRMRARYWRRVRAEGG